MFPDVGETLERLGEKYRLAVISNSSLQFLNAQLSTTGIDSVFSVKIADAAPKPDPDGLLKACKQLGLEKADVIFVGDSNFDMEAGKRANIRTLIIGNELKRIDDLLEIV